MQLYQNFFWEEKSLFAIPNFELFEVFQLHPKQSNVENFENLKIGPNYRKTGVSRGIISRVQLLTYETKNFFGKTKIWWEDKMEVGGMGHKSRNLENLLAIWS